MLSKAWEGLRRKFIRLFSNVGTTGSDNSNIYIVIVRVLAYKNLIAYSRLEAIHRIQFF